MYDFVDRPVTSLDRGGRFLIWSMRRWVRALAEHACPPNAIGPAFAKWNMIGALPDFHMAMTVLNRDALDSVHFAPLDCLRVAEDEAILLHLFRAMHDTPPDRMLAVLSLVVMEDATAPLLAALTGIARRLADAGLIPQAPALPNHNQDIPTHE
jgi:hypothetical protein